MTTIFSAVLIVAIGISVTLFAILINNAYVQKRNNKLLSIFNNAANEFRLSLSKMERIGSRIIGFDEENNKIMFLVREKRKYDGYLVDLAEIESCTVEKKYQLSGAAYIKRLGVDAIVERVVLKLNYKNGALPLALPFYQKAKDPIYEIAKRTEQANEWQHFLSRRLKEGGHQIVNDKEEMSKDRYELAVV